MNVKRFRQICNLLSYILKFFLAITAVMTVFIINSIFADPGNTITPFIDLSSRTFVQYGRGHYADADLALTAKIIIPIVTATYAYIFWKASSLFSYLADGETPFSPFFSRSVKVISVLMIVHDLIVPLLHSLILSMIMENGYSFSFGLSGYFFYGLTFYVAAEVLNYGIELQQLSDETV